MAFNWRGDWQRVAEMVGERDGGEVEWRNSGTGNVGTLWCYLPDGNRVACGPTEPDPATQEPVPVPLTRREAYWFMRGGI